MSRELIAEKLKQAMGLHSPTVGMVTISSAIEKRMRICEIDGDKHYLTRIITDPEEMKELIEAVIIPETWFFREHQPFKYVLNYFNEQSPCAKLNILSIPCSTGEEPYSIAMMLMDNNIHDTAYQIDAVDIGENNIQKALTGKYRKNSFRSEDLRFVDKYFQKNGVLFQISDSVKEKVKFYCENVLSDSFSLVNNRYDVIFCRNLLIYFDPETQRKMFSILENMLTPDGLLILGNAETVQYSDGALVPAIHTKSYVHVKKGNVEKSVPARKNKKTVSSKEQRNTTRPVKLTPRPFAEERKTVNNPPPTPVIVSNEQLGIAFELANKGRLDEALDICTAYIESNHKSSRAYYLAGIIYDAQGVSTMANQSLRKAIYLEPDNLEALVHLSLMAEQRGEHEEAMKLRDRARRVQERRST